MSDLKNRDPLLYVTKVELVTEAIVRLEIALGQVGTVAMRCDSLRDIDGGDAYDAMVKIRAQIDNARADLRDIRNRLG